MDFVDVEEGTLLTRRESETEPPNYFLRSLQGDDAGDLTALTDFPHPTPELADGPLPVLMWAYPREYKDADLAGQVTDSPHRFVRVSYWAALPMLTRGWAVLDGPSMSIIGEGGKMAIGGHSYGAFMTGNLLAHSDPFAAGIAGSGAYNRSLTPFGFQAEQRTFREAPEIYFAMSPFMNAEKVDEPMLMSHGAEDNNSGTFPIQSERMYHALKGLGGHRPARHASGGEPRL